ncbi:MAG TPA: methionine--tRNA ligase [Bryobacteraceae bacterium]|mgnify:FL=1|nr:methionine--tRNA ligase [Bryobacterales bacterium]HRJ21224.1 methionine--tRNA ligase [Bryobacteraceae bacterium]
MNEKFYLTTPIYYVNSAPHLGTSYSTLVCDSVRRYQTMLGKDALLVTGSDEHGQNVERAAKKMGKSPGEYATAVAEEFMAQWDRFGVEYRFLRTSSEKHRAVVQDLFKRCLDNGYIYPSQYKGQYCFSCELYVNDAQPGDPCPDCQRPTETVTEDNYFFKLSAFQEPLLKLYEEQPDFVMPGSRLNEIKSFVKGGLNDLSITRTSIKWGIPVPVEGAHVFYVWFDALTSYMSAVEGEHYWPADVHVIGKDILRFHAIYWPAFLMAAGLPLPKKVVAHGWILKDNAKMSKSRGNVVRPEPLRQVLGTDATRYFLMREIPFGQDGSFSYDAMITRCNADLANGLGNLASRTLTMIRQYREGRIPAAGAAPNVREEAAKTIAGFHESFQAFEFHRALEQVWALITFMDRAIVQYQPWLLAKKQDEESQRLLDEILYSAAEVVRVVTALLAPVMPEACAKIREQLGFSGPLLELRLDQLEWGQLAPGQTIGEIQPVFPRIDAAKAIEQMLEIDEKEVDRVNELLGKKEAAVEETPWTPPPGVAPLAPEITIDDFVKVDLRVARVLSAEPVKGADKLLLLTVDVAEKEPRTLVAGIAKAYTPEQLVGRKVVIVANLAPRKLRGIQSNGMIVAASLEDSPPVLAAFLEDVPVGARLK